jgi:hypothetical protein
MSTHPDVSGKILAFMLTMLFYGQSDTGGKMNAATEGELITEKVLRPISTAFEKAIC